VALAKRAREDLCFSLLSSAHLVLVLQNLLLASAFSLPFGLEGQDGTWEISEV